MASYTITSSNFSSFSGGIEMPGHARVGTTWDGNYIRTVVCRYKFTTDGYGATSISFQTENASADVGAGSGDDSVAAMRFAIGTNPTEHKTTKSSTIGYAASGSYGNWVKGSLNVKLLPNTTYYLWIFPSEGFHSYTRFNIGNCTVTTSGSYGVASTITAGNGSFGSAIPITLSNSVGGVTNTVVVTCGGISKTLGTKSSSNNFTWTPALDEYGPAIPNAKSATATITVTTFYGSAQWGTSTKTITVSFPASCAPTLSLSNPTYYNTGSAAAGINQLVQGYSRLRVTAAYTAKYGASIASVKITYDGKTVTYSSSLGSSKTLTTSNAASASGTVKATVTVTDSRGFTKSAQQAFTILAYSNPKLTNVLLYRSDDSKTADESGAYVTARAKGNISDLGGENHFTLKASCRRKSNNAAVFSDVSLTDNTKQALGGRLSADITYIASITITDALGNTATVSETIPGQAWAMKFNSTATAVGFGMAPQGANRLEIPSDWVIRRGTENALFPSDGRYFKSYFSLSQIGLESGATIAAAWAALPDGSILLAPSNQFASGQRPASYGIVEIIRRSANYGAVYYHGAYTTPDDEYRMAVGNNGPTGTWTKIVTDEQSLLTDVQSLLNNMLTVATVESAALDIAAGGNASVTASAAKSGYTPIGIVGWTLPGSGSSYAAVFRCYLSGTTLNASIRSVGNAITSTFRWVVLYRKNY